MQPAPMALNRDIRRIGQGVRVSMARHIACMLILCHTFAGRCLMWLFET
jgi:hypothetical protein